MPHDTELDFLCDVLQKLHIPAVITGSNASVGESLLSHLLDTTGMSFDMSITVEKYFGKIEPITKYVYKDRLGLSYQYLKLPVASTKNLFVVGPYLSERASDEAVLEICERNGLKPGAQRFFKEYYSVIPVVKEDDRVFAMIDTFCERIWGKPSFAIVVNRDSNTQAPLMINNMSGNVDFDDTLANISNMEMRYSFENELMRAVMLGQQHKETILKSSFGEQMFEKRINDPVRNAKNYSIILNTLLRKAAEQGGVHPVYIDKVSSDFAERIENVLSVKENAELMKTMFSTYCRLVYKHSIKKYSPIVQKTVLIIDQDLSADLSLHSLADMQGISSGYLASIFKKEVGQTVTEYVREKRIKHAAYLISTTKLQIQTVAAHCGIMDVHYFTKMFKTVMGQTPNEYRRSCAERN
jgi:AraC-like DNA-binding protein